MAVQISMPVRVAIAAMIGDAGSMSRKPACEVTLLNSPTRRGSPGRTTRTVSASRRSPLGAVLDRAENHDEPLLRHHEAAPVRHRARARRRRLNHRRAADRRVPHQEPPVGRGHRVEDRAEIIEAVGVGDLGDGDRARGSSAACRRVIDIVDAVAVAADQPGGRGEGGRRADVGQRPARVDVEVRLAEIGDVVLAIEAIPAVDLLAARGEPILLDAADRRW